jgi:hypothetical protein
MSLTILSDDDDKTATADRPDGPRFQVFVDLPEWLERLIEKLAERWIGAHKR